MPRSAVLRSPLRAWLLCIAWAGLAALPFATSRAEPAPATAQSELRARLASVRSAIGARLPEGAWLSIEHAIDVSERIAGSFAPQSKAWAARAQRWLAAASEGRDPIAGAKGEILMRGYRSPISQHLQGYAIYTPPHYDASKSYPLLLMLHGGSANGNLFLGVVLGNNMNWKEYDQHLWDDYAPRWSPEFIVVAPDGFGHVMWRWMGEQDVLDVIADVQKHYSVDADRIALGGLSNGGVGAYNLGLRHASRFSVVTPIAGAPSWLQYAGDRFPDAQRRMMEPLSGMSVAENAINTDLRYFHGHLDGGPMKPRFVEEFTRTIAALGVPFTEKWFDAGHDLLYLVHRHGRIYKDLEPLRRKRHVSEVRIVTGDYRANRQHWVTVTRIASYPQLARVRAVVSGDRIDIESTHVKALQLDLNEAPLAASGHARITVNGNDVYDGPRAALGAAPVFTMEPAGCSLQTSPRKVTGLEKRPGLSGPITDSYYDAVLHVYGTQDPAATEALKRTAERSASGSPLWLWRVKQRVLADTELTDELMRTHHVVLYATPGSHRVLERMRSALPIQIDATGVAVGTKRFEQRGVGVKFVYPNPLAPERYVIVQAAPTTAGVEGGRQLPDFLPDYVVYDAATTATRPRLTFPNKPAPPALGYFDDAWQLPGAPKPEHAALRLPVAPKTDAVTSATFRIGIAPPVLVSIAASAPARTWIASGEGSLTPLEPPPPPASFAAAETTQAGKAARAIAKRVQLFSNYRSHIKNAIWTLDPRASWSIRGNDACMQALAERGVRARAYDAPLTTPVAAPVEVLAPVAGLALRMIHIHRPLLMSCELAARLPELAALLKPHGVTGIDVMSAYRDHPFPSFHTLGLALDISRFETDRGPLSVKQDFEKTPSIPTCEGAPVGKDAAQRLRAIACSLASSHVFSSVLTPNYNAGHHDHFHVDIRPDDPRLFVR